MKPKKKSRRCRGLGLDSGLDLAISRFIYSLGFMWSPVELTDKGKGRGVWDEPNHTTTRKHGPL
jgi:hypothetical protein